MILFKECLKNGLVPFVISDDKKIEYYHALNTAQFKGDYAPLEAFFVEEQTSYYQQVEGFVLPFDAARTAARNSRQKTEEIER